MDLRLFQYAHQSSTDPTRLVPDGDSFKEMRDERDVLTKDDALKYMASLVNAACPSSSSSSSSSVFEDRGYGAVYIHDEDGEEDDDPRYVASFDSGGNLEADSFAGRIANAIKTLNVYLTSNGDGALPVGTVDSILSDVRNRTVDYGLGLDARLYVIASMKDRLDAEGDDGVLASYLEIIHRDYADVVRYDRFMAARTAQAY